MKIGIITMHKVMNYGSILQAYAMQRKIKEIGVDNAIIDYTYPPKTRTTIKQIPFVLLQELLDFISGFPKRRKLNRFKKFYKQNLDLTDLSYNKQSIAENPPIFDAYLSGSDQVWNPRFIQGDTSFLLSFVPDDKPRASYASSFAINEIPEDLSDLYANYLNKYNKITVRESSGISIVRKLTDKKATLVCDPTLLLNATEWSESASNSELIIKEKYILVYILSYMYNPYPQISKIVDKVQKELGNIKIIYIIRRKEDSLKPNTKLFKDVGPNEFIYLFKNAEFVITTSFHGTAFSLIFGKPFYSVVKSLDDTDGRMPSLLKQLNCQNSLISYDSEDIANRKDLLKLKCDSDKLKEFREHSINELKNILNILKENSINNHLKA